MGWPYPWNKIQDPLVIPAGALRSQITIQQQSTTPDAVSGAPSSTWKNVYTCTAYISTVSSKEMFLANQFTGEATHLITFPWPGPNVPIAAGMQVAYVNGQVTRTFTIQAPPENVQEANRRINLICLEVE